MELVFDLDISRCSACGACAVACMDQNDIDIKHGFTPFRAVFDLERNGKFAYMSISCMHCEDAPCIMSCPVGCLMKDPATNLTIYDTSSCIGCHSCAMACPYGAPSFAQDGKMVKCDGCITRIQNGMQLACILACPTGALSLKTKAEYVKSKRERSLKKIADASFYEV